MNIDLIQIAFNRLVDLIKPLLPTITALLAVKFSNELQIKNDEKERQKSIQQERFDNFYQPYVNFFIKNVFSLYDVSADLEILRLIEEQLDGNFKYMGKESQKYLINFYEAKVLYDTLRTNGELRGQELTIYDRVNNSFFQLNKRILIESKQLAEQLGYSDFAQSIFDIYGPLDRVPPLGSISLDRKIK
ncbi:hypothetical protein [Aerococcus kribbianus]|uniref:Uncharacterized protein n=1 Tax=Aerococcus kribbianus TaxID=2999064 RepID=A0A9X3JF48_9LACT|nr:MULTISPECIES: hypothetical protein [unclassified Aerococcus]MCZ0717860.1 hypothetical protein [Aerococcus sp. YH-aer221]MCZ0726147.1 hypothetical protein [Aerococcus sp. YH-aer222]